MREIETLLRELKRYGNAGRDCALAAEDALAIAAALEAAREDAERLDALEELVAEQRDKTLMLHHGRDPSSYVYAGLGLSNMNRTLRQAIDQARGKGGGEVEGG